METEETIVLEISKDGAEVLYVALLEWQFQGLKVVEALQGNVDVYMQTDSVKAALELSIILKEFLGPERLKELGINDSEETT